MGTIGPRVFVLSCLFIASLSVLNIVSSKIVALGGLTFSVGSYLYAVTFPITDAISEVKGKAFARRLVLYGFAVNIFVIGVVAFSAWHPPAPFWGEQNKAFQATLYAAPRIMVASMIAYLVAQFHDIWAFHFWKAVTKGKFLWLRNNLSTFTSQIVDTSIFTVLAFAGTMPISGLVSVAMGGVIVKIVLALIDTPVVYATVAWLRSEHKQI